MSDIYKFSLKYIKFFFILILLALLIIIYLYNKFKMNKIIRKIASLPISLQNIINNYISDISPKFKYEIYQERNKLVSLLTLVNYSTIPNISLKNELKLKLIKRASNKRTK